MLSIARYKLILICASVLLFVFASIWWWRYPTKPTLLSDKEIFQKQQQADVKTTKKDVSLVRRRDAEIVALKKKLATATAELEAKAEKSLQKVFKAGPDAISKLASERWRPGTLDALKAAAAQQRSQNGGE